MNKNTQFKSVEYRLIEEFNDNESDITDNLATPPVNIDESLYHSALETASQSDNIQLNIRNKNKRSTHTQQNPLLNATMYSKQENDDHKNKFVNDTTMTSYLSISDLQLDAKENVDLLRCNLSKIDNRGEKIHEMEVKTEVLSKGAEKFKRTSRLLKDKIFWANVVNWLVVAFFIFLIVYLIIKLT